MAEQGQLGDTSRGLRQSRSEATTRRDHESGEVAVADVLVLRSSRAGGLSHSGFRWPMEVGAVVVAPDWDPSPVCGGGLHGWLWGEGDGHLACTAETAVWHVLEVDASLIVELGGKVKFPRATVAFCGTLDEAVAWLQERAPGRAVVFGTATAGDDGTATAGYSGTATAGDDGTATAGYRGTATAGDRGTATVGDSGTATAGYVGTATAGYRGTATVGDRGTATVGDRGTATAGKYGTATAGDDGTATAGDCGTAAAGYRGTATAGKYGTATAGKDGTATAGDDGTATAGDDGTATAGNFGTAAAGDRGTATAGYAGTATAGDDGTIMLKRWDDDAERWLYVVAYVGEGGVEPNVPYRLDKSGALVKAEENDG